MNRLVWFAAGAGVGAYALTRARRAAEVLTPEGLADRLAGLSLGLHLLRDEVRAGMAEKEADVRERLSLPAPGSGATVPELSAPPERPTTREGND